MKCWLSCLEVEGVAVEYRQASDHCSRPHFHIVTLLDSFKGTGRVCRQKQVQAVKFDGGGLKRGERVEIYTASKKETKQSLD